MVRQTVTPGTDTHLKCDRLWSGFEGRAHRTVVDWQVSRRSSLRFFRMALHYAASSMCYLIHVFLVAYMVLVTGSVWTHFTSVVLSTCDRITTMCKQGYLTVSDHLLNSLCLVWVTKERVWRPGYGWWQFDFSVNAVIRQSHSSVCASAFYVISFWAHMALLSNVVLSTPW